MTTTYIPRDEKVARYADLFVEKFAVRAAPIASLQAAMFGSHPVVGEEKILILEGATQALVLGMLDDRPADRASLANNVIAHALKILNSGVACDRLSLVKIIGDAARGLEEHLD